jgi:hypothetical protein
MNRAEVLDALQRSPEAFLEATLFDQVPHGFAADRSRFVEWKRTC